ncbi:hypothetical protein [Candidatus Nitrosocosmicus sp. T]
MSYLQTNTGLETLEVVERMAGITLYLDWHSDGKKGGILNAAQLSTFNFQQDTLCYIIHSI